MRQIAARILMIALCLSLLVGYMPAKGLAAERRPYFKTYGADVMSGGWFYHGNTCNTSLNPIDNPNPPPNNLLPNYQDGRGSVDKITGGIMAYTRSTPAGSHFNAAGGSSSQFAAYVLGVVDGNNASNYGFYSNGSGGGPVTGRTFANSAAVVSPTQWGGLFQDDQFDGSRQTYCIPDYFSRKPANYKAIPTASGRLVNGTASDVYYVDGTAAPFKITHNSPVNLNTGAASNITIYVNGDAYIDQNITSNVSDPSGNVNNLPKFAVVAKGSIYIDPNVTELYGFYIAQPDPSNINAVTDDDGVIWTCHDNTTTPPLYTWPAEIVGGIERCARKLTITGALVAKQVNFLRINGDIGSANLAEDPLGGMGSGNIAEVINYHPAIPLDGPFFTVTASGSIRNKIDSLISLPPVF